MTEFVRSIYMSEEDHKHQAWAANGAQICLDDTPERCHVSEQPVRLVTLGATEGESAAYVLLDRRQVKRLRKWLKEWLEVSK